MLFKKRDFIVAIYFVVASCFASGAILQAADQRDAKNKHYYCIPADEKHMHMLKNLIGSIHKVDFDNVGEIAVFNLGLTAQQVRELNCMQKVHVYAVEITNPDLLTYFKTAPEGRKVRGYFAWKPVVMKQSLEMFPYVLYLDAGTTILKPMNDVFEYIQQHGYFLVSCSQTPNCNIVNRITKKVLDSVVCRMQPAMQDFLLAEDTMVYDYLGPVYVASQDLSLFEDDGSAKFGYGAGRHDQILFSIYAHYNQLKIHPEGWLTLPLRDRTVRTHMHWDSAYVNADTVIYRSRHDIHFQGGSTQFIRYKN
jgi:hypothetical protein